jgi:hypothetical protein
MTAYRAAGVLGVAEEGALITAETASNVPLPRRWDIAPGPNRKLIGRESFDIDPNKFDYFYGNVKAPNPELKLSDPKSFKQLDHNYKRSQQMKRILEAEGMGNTAVGREKLLNLFDEAAKGPEISRHVGDYGTTITRTVETPNVKYDVKFFYESGDLSLKPKVTTMIPKVKK